MVQLLRRYKNLPKLAQIERLPSEDFVPIAQTARSRYIHNIYRRLGPETIATILADYESGKTGEQVAGRHGIAASTVTVLAREAGIKKRYHLSPEQIETAIKRYSAGATVAQIADLLGFSSTAVLSALHKNGVRLRPRGRPKRSKS